MGGAIPDPGWTFRDTDKVAADQWRHENDPSKVPDINTTWPWNPVFPSNDPSRALKHVPPEEESDINQPDYVLIEGALISDDPHWQEPNPPKPSEIQRREASMAWGDRKIEYGLQPKENKINPTRWTEIHPPDRVEVLPNKPLRQAVRCVAVLARPGEERTLDIKITPPGPRPDPQASVECIEDVGPETRRESIIVGNLEKTGALITKTADAVSVFVTVRGEAGSLVSPKRYGQFKAIYRVFWRLGPAQLRILPLTIPAAQPISLTVNAYDWHSGIPIRGPVQLNGQVIGETNASLTFTFHERDRLSVLATGYNETQVPVSIVLRKLHVWSDPPVIEGSDRVTVFAEDAETHAAVPTAKVYVSGIEVASVGVPFNFHANCKFRITKRCPPPCRRICTDPPRPGCCEPPIEECVPEGYWTCPSIHVNAIDYEKQVVYEGQEPPD